MHHKMPFKIKNWKLTALACVFICLFIALGVWQLSRAQQKKLLIQSFSQRTQFAPLKAQDLHLPQDQRFYRITLEGYFDNPHTLLLDNKIFHGKVGYEVFTPFKAKGINQAILIDRGFIPIVRNRNEVPKIQSIQGNQFITGMLNLTPTYVALGEITESSQTHFPLKVEYLNLDELKPLLGYSLFPYLVSLAPDDERAYAIEWQIVTMSPEKHMGYAVQWFALAITLLILSVALNREKKV